MKINKEQFDKIRETSIGRNSKVGSVLREVAEIDVGEGIIIKADRWSLKSRPSEYIGGYFVGKKFKVKSLHNKKAWACLRIK